MSELSKPLIINERWKIIKPLGAGGFGRVYQCLDLRTSQVVALKVSRGWENTKSLFKEATIYNILSEKFPNHSGFLRKYHFEKERNQKAILVLDCFGISMRDALTRYHEKHKSFFPINTVADIGMKIVKILADFHMTGYIHNDLKSCNLLVEENDLLSVKLIDHGLSKSISDNGPIHPKFRTLAQYSNLPPPVGKEVGPLEDYIQLGYLLLELYWGRYRFNMGGTITLLNSSQETTIPDMCKQMGRGMVKYFHYVFHPPQAKPIDIKYLLEVLTMLRSR